jgi:hypothetical protein
LILKTGPLLEDANEPPALTPDPAFTGGSEIEIIIIKNQTFDRR